MKIRQKQWKLTNYIGSSNPDLDSNGKWIARNSFPKRPKNQTSTPVYVCTYKQTNIHTLQRDGTIKKWDCEPLILLPKTMKTEERSPRVGLHTRRLPALLTKAGIRLGSAKKAEYSALFGARFRLLHSRLLRANTCFSLQACLFRFLQDLHTSATLEFQQLHILRKFVEFMWKLNIHWILTHFINYSWKFYS